MCLFVGSSQRRHAWGNGLTTRKTSAPATKCPGQFLFISKPPCMTIIQPATLAMTYERMTPADSIIDIGYDSAEGGGYTNTFLSN